MADMPTTRASLLVRLRDPHDRDAWGHFVEVYGPLIFGYARRRGLQDADAADVTQEVLQQLSHVIPEFAYDRGRGTFRGWLFTIVHHRVFDFAARSRKQEHGSGDTGIQQRLEQRPGPEQEAEWNAEWQRRLFHCAAEWVRPSFEEKTWLAFWRTAVDGAKAPDVANELSLSVGAVYIARSRVLAKIKERVQELEDVEGGT
jgi:RNA polymerase sigma-70 factor (ECF subfamily)